MPAGISSLISTTKWWIEHYRWGKSPLAQPSSQQQISRWEEVCALNMIECLLASLLQKNITNCLLVYLTHVPASRRKKDFGRKWCSQKGRRGDRKKELQAEILSQRAKQRGWRELTFFATLPECFWLSELFITGNCDVSFGLGFLVPTGCFQCLLCTLRRPKISSKLDWGLVKADFRQPDALSMC